MKWMFGTAHSHLFPHPLARRFIKSALLARLGSPSQLPRRARDSDDGLLRRRSIALPPPSLRLLPLPRRPLRLLRQNRPLRLRPGLHRQPRETLQASQPLLIPPDHHQVRPKDLHTRDATRLLPCPQPKDPLALVWNPPNVLRDLPTLLSTLKAPA